MNILGLGVYDSGESSDEEVTSPLVKIQNKHELKVQVEGPIHANVTSLELTNHGHGKRLVSYSSDGTMKIWNCSTGDEIINEQNDLFEFRKTPGYDFRLEDIYEVHTMPFHIAIYFRMEIINF